MDNQLDITHKQQNIKEIVDIYCDVRSREHTYIEVGEGIIFGLVVLLNIFFWWFKSRKNRRAPITLNA